MPRTDTGVCFMFLFVFLFFFDGGSGGGVGGFVDNSVVVVQLLFGDIKCFEVNPKLLSLHGLECLEHDKLLLEQPALDVFFDSIIKPNFETSLPNNSNDGIKFVGILDIEDSRGS